MINWLNKQLELKLAKVSDLRRKIENAETVEEIRAASAEIDELNNEISEIRALIDSDDDEQKSESFDPLDTFKNKNADDNRSDDDPTMSTEYRTAFMNNVLKNEPIPDNLRANTLTSDVASVIPTTLVNDIIEKMDVCGMILPLVTRTSYASGIVIPTSSVKPVASWVNEGAGSTRQKKTTGKITFTYFKLRCEISMSMEVGTMALAVFEQKFVENVAKAMVIAIEKAIIAGDGETQPFGILSDTIPETQTITLSDTTTGVPTYQELVEAEMLIPIEYEGNAKWFMTKAQFGQFLKMVDDNDQPIARVNYGIAGSPERTLLGRDVVIHPYAEEMGDYAAAIFDFSDYVLNTIYDMGIQKKQDWDTEDLLTKAVMSVDGKPVSIDSLVVMK